MFDKNLLLKLINDIEEEYLNFSEFFYETNDDIDISKIKNLNTYSVGHAVKDDYFMEELIPKYHSNIEKFEVNSYFLEYHGKSKFRCRAKLLNSVYTKLEHYHYLERNKGAFYIRKSLNDMWGARIILKDLNNNIDGLKEMLDNLKYRNVISRFYLKNKQGYKATHCYFQTNNRYFPWELQIWDSLDEKNNVVSHIRHEKEKEKH